MQTVSYIYVSYISLRQNYLNCLFLFYLTDRNTDIMNEEFYNQTEQKSLSFLIVLNNNKHVFNCGIETELDRNGKRNTVKTKSPLLPAPVLASVSSAAQLNHTGSRKCTGYILISFYLFLIFYFFAI